MNLNSELKFVLQRLAELDARITLLEARPLPPAVGVEVAPPPPPPGGAIQKLIKALRRRGTDG